MRRCALGFIAIAGLLAYGAAAEEQKTPELDPKVCQQMVAYHPDAVNGADYKPGVDVHGKPVVEADINPPALNGPDTISFELTVDIARYAGIIVPVGTEGRAPIGLVTVDKTGHMTFNGQPLEGSAEAALRELCAPRPAPPQTNDSNHNQ